MIGRVKIIQKKPEVVDGRSKITQSEYYSCWCEVQSLGTNEQYTALQTKLENTIAFEVRKCEKVEYIRLNLKEFYVVYQNVEFKIYSASPKFTDNQKVLLKCCSST